MARTTRLPRKVSPDPKPIRGSAEGAALALYHATEDEKIAVLVDPATSPTVVLGLIRHAGTEIGVLEAISQSRRWLGYYDIISALCFQPRTPTRTALQLLQRLYAVDLVKLLGQVRLAPPLRASAASLLKTRISTLSPGERLGLARHARGPAAGILLPMERDPRALDAVLELPGLRELDVLLFVNDPATPAELLASVGRQRRWSSQPAVRAALARNPKSPPSLALSMLETLTIQELKPLIADERISAAVRLIARRYAEEKQGLGPFARKNPAHPTPTEEP